MHFVNLELLIRPSVGKLRESGRAKEVEDYSWRIPQRDKFKEVILKKSTGSTLDFLTVLVRCFKGSGFIIFYTKYVIFR